MAVETVKIPEEVVFENVADEAVLLHLETGTYFGLNSAGRRIWELLAASGNPQCVLERMLQEYDVRPELLEADLARLLKELEAKKLITFARDS
jgi:Coenzyme PQQ synthesis protein D (PqqD)